MRFTFLLFSSLLLLFLLLLTWPISIRVWITVSPHEHWLPTRHYQLRCSSLFSTRYCQTCWLSSLGPITSWISHTIACEVVRWPVRTFSRQFHNRGGWIFLSFIQLLELLADLVLSVIPVIFSHKFLLLCHLFVKRKCLKFHLTPYTFLHHV